MSQVKQLTSEDLKSLPPQIRNLLLAGKQIQQTEIKFMAPPNATPDQLQAAYEAHLKQHPDAMSKGGIMLKMPVKPKIKSRRLKSVKS